MIKVGNDSFRQTQFGPKAFETISQRRWRGRNFSASGLSNFWQIFGEFVFATQRRFLPKLKVCPSFVSSTNPAAQNSKLENNALDNTSLLLMYRRYNLLFYSQFGCAIARFLFSNISVSFRLAFSIYIFEF